jgi:hypothetical protein
VQEFVAITLMDNETGADGLPERRMRRFLILLVRDAQHADLGHVTQVGEVLQGILRGDRQPVQFADHEVHHVVGVVLGVDTIDVPGPDGRGGVEREQTLVRQCDQEMNREERIAVGLLLYELRQGSCMLRRAVQGVGDEPADVAEPERREHDLVHACTGLADRLERMHEWM